MTLIEDARRMAEDNPSAPYPDEGCWRCMFCLWETPWVFEAVPSQFFHEDDCPWFALPKIVAALDAAEELLEHTVGWSLRCVFCHECLEHGEHGEYCPWQALVAAMKGDGA